MSAYNFVGGTHPPPPQGLDANCQVKAKLSVLHSSQHRCAMTETEYVASFRQPENYDPEEAKKKMINFVRALARADARRDASETKRRDADVSL